MGFPCLHGFVIAPSSPICVGRDAHIAPRRHVRFVKRMVILINLLTRRRGGHRPPAPCAAAPLAPSLRELSAKLTEGVPRAAARVSIWFAAKSKVPARADVGIGPYAWYEEISIKYDNASSGELG